MDEDVDEIPYVDSSQYAWPPASGRVEDDCYCHIAEYIVINENNQFVELLDCGSDVPPPNGRKRSYRAVGTLIPPAGSAKTAKRTQFSVLNYALDFGDDDDRGFWLCDKYSVWYKMERPRADYVQHATRALRFSAEFFKLIDVLLKPDKNGVNHSREVKGFYNCNKSLEFLHQATNGAFDIDVLMADSSLLYNRLKPLFVCDCALMKCCKEVSFY